jgi:hypothetical protein
MGRDKREHKLKIVDAKEPERLDIEYQYPADGPGIITQADLAELAVLRKQRREPDAAVKEKRFVIRHKLERGVQVEPGFAIPGRENFGSTGLG